MNDVLYLSPNYRRTIPRESTSDVLDEIKAEIARIDALKLGANLATRDFASYANRSELEKLLNELEIPGTFALVETQDTAVMFAQSPPTGVLAATENFDTANFTGGT